MAIYTTYTVVNTNSFNGNGISLRYAGDDTAPVFVAKDIVLALGYSWTSITWLTKDLPGLCEIDRLRNSGIGNHIMLGLTVEDVEILLAKKLYTYKNPEKELKRAAFRDFWKNEVLPQIANPALRKKIIGLETEKADLVDENARLRAELEAYKAGKIKPFMNESA